MVFQAWNPPMRSVAPITPRPRRVAAVRLEAEADQVARIYAELLERIGLRKASMLG